MSNPVVSYSFLVGPDKETAQTRYDRGLVVTSQSPSSALCAAHGDMKTAAATVATETVTLKGVMDAYKAAEGTFKAARTALGMGIVAWDGAYDVFVSTGEKYASSDNDISSLGGEPRTRTNNPLALPISVDFTYNPKQDYLKVHVHRAPGMRVVTVQLSPDPITASSWFELDGTGAVQTYPSPPKGTWWARAQSRTAKAKSAFTTPVSVLVK